MSDLARQLTGFGDALGDQGFTIATPDWGVSAAAAQRPSVRHTSAPFEVRCSGVTDPGVAGKQNQDDFFLWESLDGRCMMWVCAKGGVRGGRRTCASAGRGVLAGCWSLTKPPHLTPTPSPQRCGV